VRIDNFVVANVVISIIWRCIQLAWPVAKDNPAAWAELLSKVKDGLLSAFDTAVSQRDDEVRRSESQQSMPGWNFCTFFILKVRKATGLILSTRSCLHLFRKVWLRHSRE
jgi:hypothetical protein